MFSGVSKTRSHVQDQPHNPGVSHLPSHLPFPTSLTTSSYNHNHNLAFSVMSLSNLPKELRLQIWTLTYFAEPPRLVALRTKPHDSTHDETSFCPRYSPSPAPLIVNICQESRAEAYYQAGKAGHLVRHHVGAANEAARCAEAYFFRFDTDILYLPLDDKHVSHFDDSPEVGFLEHFRITVEDASLLRNIAVTRVIKHGYKDGGLSNVLCHFSNILSMTMMVSEKVLGSKTGQDRFVHAARNIWMMYHFDRARLWGIPTGVSMHETHIDVDFATLVNGQLNFKPKHEWANWSKLGCEWMFTKDTGFAVCDGGAGTIPAHPIGSSTRRQ